MCEFQRAGDVHRNAVGALPVDPAVLALATQQVGQAFALDVFQADPTIRPVLARAGDADEVRMAQRQERLQDLDEPLHLGVALGEVGRQDFQRHDLVMLEVLSAKDDAVMSGAKHGADFEVSQSVAREFGQPIAR